MSYELFRVESTPQAQIIELTLPQILDSAEFDQLNDSMLAVVRSGARGKWVLDLAQVSYMGSAMLGLMVNLRQHVKSAGGTLVLCSLPASLLRIFQTCCMEKLFVITKTRA